MFLYRAGRTAIGTAPSSPGKGSFRLEQLAKATPHPVSCRPRLGAREVGSDPLLEVFCWLEFYDAPGFEGRGGRRSRFLRRGEQCKGAPVLGVVELQRSRILLRDRDDFTTDRLPLRAPYTRVLGDPIPSTTSAPPALIRGRVALVEAFVGV